MGGRGANSKIGSQEKISPMAARIAFNAAKKIAVQEMQKKETVK